MIRSSSSRRKVVLGFALVLLVSLVPFSGAQAFTDVGPTGTYSDAIGDLASRGVVSGFPDGSFKPSASITRMQFAKMIARAHLLPVSESDVCPFADVPGGLDPNDPLYPDKYVAVCAAYGITQGETAVTFAPFKPISQQQLMTMVTRVANLADPPTDYAPPFERSQFTLLEHYANGTKAAFHGLLTSFEGLASGHSYSRLATRGEACLLLHNLLKHGSADQGMTGLVTGVADGDTLHVQLGATNESVRLIGIDTAEMGEAYSYEAKDALDMLAGGKTVRLETDVEERDQYGRLLAYVWVGSTMANAEVLRQGLATLYTVAPNVEYADMLRAAQDEAQAAERGIWAPPTGHPLEILQVNYDPPGNDNLTLNEEYVVLQVLVPGTLLGYAVEDESGHRYEFPDRVFRRGQVFKLHTGVGTDTQTDLHWGMTGSAIWNNSGDTVKVLDPQGRMVTRYFY